jgi:acetyltransferase-like isoleucine patch superfamily enzyme
MVEREAPSERRGPRLIIEDGVYVGRFVQINAWQDVVIERDVMIADRVLITDVDHTYGDARVPLMHQAPLFKGRVVLAEGCWIGAGAVILPGVRIGRNSVVGANAVVTEDVTDHSVAVGVPAWILKSIDGNIS